LSSIPPNPEDRPREPERAGFDAPGGVETILIVDDEPLVLRLCTSILSRQGYSVLSAGGADEALRHCEEKGKELQLLLSDIVMPKLRGTDLADRILAKCPGVRVLYMSGFDARDIPEYEILKRSAKLIRKPFTPRDLLVAVRAALDKPAAL
jgi:DNA-binding NtrC family response regulator